MSKETQGIKTYNTVRDLSSERLRAVFPEGNKGNIQMIKSVVCNDAYQLEMNEFVTNLINKIGLTIVRNKTFENPLRMFKKGAVPLGTDIEDLYTNPAEEQEYEYSNEAMAKLLTINDPDTHVAYYRRNRKALYERTIAMDLLQGAFTSWEKFNDVVAGITNSLYSGNYRDEFRYTKGLIDGAYKSGKVIVEKVGQVKDKDSGEDLLIKLKALYEKMCVPSTEYNAYTKFDGAKGEIETWTTPDRICVILPADVKAIVDVKALAAAFNIDHANFVGRVITVDKFDNPEIQALICDESFLQIYDDLMTMRTFENGRTLSYKYMLHCWQTYAICPFANAVCLATTDVTIPATEITFNDGPSIDLKVGEEKIVEITTTPNNAGPVQFESTNNGHAKVERINDKYAKITGVGTGTPSIKAKVTGHDDTIASLTVNVTEAEVMQAKTMEDKPQTTNEKTK